MDFSTQYPNLNFPEGPANSSTLTKQHFVEILYDRLGLSRQEATQVIESIFSEIELALLDGRDVKLAAWRPLFPLRICAIPLPPLSTVKHKSLQRSKPKTKRLLN